MVAERVRNRLEELFRLGAGRGANRPGLSLAEQQACELAAEWMAAAGLEVAWDAAGNVFGRLAGLRPELAEVWTGSHLDSVPDGGRFDGALGVVAGIEAVELLSARERALRTVAVVVFRDEEGSRFEGGCFGSRALSGRLEEGDLGKRDRSGTTLAQALAALGLTPPPPEGWLGSGPHSFVETHVEQGPRLANAGVPLGVVNAIVGTAGMEVAFHGRAGHAGTTPMDGRADALCAAADVVLAVRAAPGAVRGSVATVGNLETWPGAANVVPGRAELVVDMRAPDRAGLDTLAAVVERAARDAADRYGCGVEVAPAWRYEPTAMAPEPTRAIREAIAALGLPIVELASGAGHDAGVLAGAGVPAGMLFVRSLADGVSHVPEEETDAEALRLAVEALAGAVARLAVSQPP